MGGQPKKAEVEKSTDGFAYTLMYCVLIMESDPVPLVATNFTVYTPGL
jgi:hypothetical protein